mgnify:CR=1 FL=1
MIVMKAKKARKIFAGAAGVTAIDSCSDVSEFQGHMNVIYIMCDDHSYQTISACDRTLTYTPNIDRLSDEGYRFRNSFVAN